MASTPLLASPESLRVLLRVGTSGSLDDDEYTLLILGQASNAVRDAANRQDWVTVTSDTADAGTTHRPSTASDVTLWVAQRAWTNPSNLERRTSGPISEAFRDTGVYGVELTDNDRTRLAQIPGISKSGLWALDLVAGFPPSGPIYLPSPADRPGGIGLYIADEGQFPYGSR